jgi:hypothetical protein
LRSLKIRKDIEIVWANVRLMHSGECDDVLKAEEILKALKMIRALEIELKNLGR